MHIKMSFILNDRVIHGPINPAQTVLDMIRDHRLTGTRIGCREGDCGGMYGADR